MKKSLNLLSILFISLGMTSCLDWAQSHTTPVVRSSYFVRNATDTLGINIDKDNGYYKLDTIAVGDKVKFNLIFDAVGNNLSGAQINIDTTIVGVTYGPLSDITSILLPESDTIGGQFFFVSGYRAVQIPVTYVAKKQGAYRFNFVVTSDSKYSPASSFITGYVKE